MIFESNHADPFRLTSAFLVYSGRRGYHLPQECLVTRHEVKDGSLLPGTPIDLPTARAVFQMNASDKKSDADIARDLVRWTHPRTLAEHPNFAVWWTPAGKRNAFVAGKSRHVWFPAMVWCGHRTRPLLYLWAFCGDNDPNQNTTVYKPQYGPEDGTNHIHSDCALCIGSAPTDDKTPAGWERTFFDSNFKTAGNLPATSYDPSTRFQKLGTLCDVVAKALPSRGAAD